MKKSVKIIIGVIAILLLAGGGFYYWYNSYKVPHDNAVTEFNQAKSVIEKENEKLDTAIQSAQKILDSKEIPYDQETFTNLQVIISQSKENMKAIPSLPKKTDDINKETTILEEPVDYSDDIKQIESAQENAVNSITQYKQITNPTGDFIVGRLDKIEQINDIQAVTEENDPNGNLNKQGGYTSAIFFTSTNVNQDEFSTNDVIEKGTESGGSIEVYETVEDAEKRNTYLSSFDGSGMLNPGSHTVLGTIVIRTSDKLTASQQKELEAEIIDNFIALD